MKEIERKVKYKYPEIVEVLKVLYKAAYISGKESSGDDGYDWLTAYKELLPIITKLNKEVLKEMEREVAQQIIAEINRVIIEDGWVDEDGEAPIINLDEKLWKEQTK